jgi:hypothetical protein
VNKGNRLSLEHRKQILLDKSWRYQPTTAHIQDRRHSTFAKVKRNAHHCQHNIQSLLRRLLLFEVKLHHMFLSVELEAEFGVYADG